MLRKLNFWDRRRQKSAAARRSSRNLRSRNTTLGIESLETRCLLAVNPVLSLESGQFFGQGGSFTPFRATFTDVSEDGTQNFDYSIDWGDGSAIDTGNTFRYQSDGGFFLPPGDPVPLHGIFEAYHSYASADQYTVTVTLTDGLGGSDTKQTEVNVYPVDNGLRVDGFPGFADEGTPFEFSLSEANPSGPPRTVANISSWTINWGDSIEQISGNPSSVNHTYGDNDAYPAAFPDSPGTRRISLAATGSNGTYFAWSGFFTEVADVATVSQINGPAEINEGETYTLDLSAIDPGDPIQGWLVSWGDEGFDIVPGNPVSVDHVYQNGDAEYTIFAAPISGIEALDVVFSPVTVHNVAPTLDDATLGVPEHSPNGTVVGTLSVVNPANDALTFSVLGGTGVGVFDVNETTGEVTVLDGSLLDVNTHPSFTLNVQVSDGEGGVDTATVTINVTRLANVSGVVFVDVNHNGLFDANEPGIDGVTVKLLDSTGTTTLDTTVTSNDGLYLFEGLQPGTYQVSETQPTGVTDGSEHLGSLGGTVVANDRMRFTITGADALDYAFAEFGGTVASGDAAGVGFWHNKTGQALIAQGGTQLVAWLSSEFPNVFGNSLAGMSGSQLAAFYRDQVFKGLSKSGGTPKVDAQFMSVAMATYFTSRTLAGNVAAAYGFNVTDTGIGTKVVNVGTKGAAFNVANGSSRTIMQLLLATNSLTDQPNSQLGFVSVYDRDGNGVISSAEADLRRMADDVFSSINNSGGI
jgi:hypothetical protein